MHTSDPASHRVFTSVTRRKISAKKRYRQTPADWYSYYIEAEREESARGDFENAAESDKQRKRDAAYLRDSIKLLRKYVKGFDAADGFDLKQLIFIPKDRIDRVRKYVPEIRRELSSGAEGHVLYRPRTKRTRAAVETFTGQTDIPRRTAFVVFTDKPEKTRVSMVTRKHTIKDKLGRKRRVAKTTVRLTEDFKGGRTEEDYFLFADYGEDNFTLFEDMRETIRAMLPHMPKGWYVFMSSSHGKIAAPMRREQILSELEQQWMQYDVVESKGVKDNRGLAQTIVGLKLVATTLEGANREYNARYSKAEKMGQWRRRLRSVERQKAISRLAYEPHHKFKGFSDPRKAKYCQLCGLTRDRHPK